MQVVYEDNHIIIVNKAVGEIVQGDKTGDTPLVEIVRQYIKEKYAKPGNVFCGVVHRLDRPVSGLVVFAKTSKALTRLNEMFRTGKVKKTYWAVTRGCPDPAEARIEGYITSVERNNKSYFSKAPAEGAKQAALSYRLIAKGLNYNLLEVNLETGRKHQIRVQLSSIGCPIKGDLKYGDKRSNPDGGISLMARRIQFTHPVSGKEIDLTAPVPDERLWHELEQTAVSSGQARTPDARSHSDSASC
ncbi:MAG: RNA pseudouridine synthase [Muribaculaceae bacterium]|nr:RNA pseudouridine synthase [Muribaculaceae bacterium]